MARVPAGQVCREAGGEADHRLWVRPQDALDRGLGMMPPTAAVLADLATAPDVAAALAAPRALRAVRPQFVLSDDGELLFRLPDEPT